MEPSDVEQTLRAAHGRNDRNGVVRLLVEAYGAELLGFLAALLRDEDAARDLFSDVSESILRNLDSFEGRSSYRTWAYAIARNAAFNHRRRKPYARLNTEQESHLVAEERSTTRPFLRTENKALLSRLRAELDVASQALLTLRIDRDMSWTEIARILEDDPLPDDDSVQRAAARMRKRFERIKERLRELIAGSAEAASDG